MLLFIITTNYPNFQWSENPPLKALVPPLKLAPEEKASMATFLATLDMLAIGQLRDVMIAVPPSSTKEHIHGIDSNTAPDNR